MNGCLSCPLMGLSCVLVICERLSAGSLSGRGCPLERGHPLMVCCGERMALESVPLRLSTWLCHEQRIPALKGCLEAVVRCAVRVGGWVGLLARVSGPHAFFQYSQRRSALTQFDACSARLSQNASARGSHLTQSTPPPFAPPVHHGSLRGCRYTAVANLQHLSG